MCIRDRYYRALLRRAGVEAKSLVDAGCGTGRMTVELAREGARVVGVDISEGMLRVAAERLRREGVRAQLAHEAVSYTHLDVYKRQPRNGERPAGRKADRPSSRWTR